MQSSHVEISMFVHPTTQIVLNLQPHKNYSSLGSFAIDHPHITVDH